MLFRSGTENAVDLPPAFGEDAFALCGEGLAAAIKGSCDRLIHSVLGMGLCVALAFSSCKSSESAYKKAYEKAKQQELAEAPADQVEATPVEAAPVVSAPVTTAPVAGPVREEKVELVSGDGLKAYSVVCGSFGVKANAEGLKQYLDGQGYNAKVVYNAERNMYRVIASSYDDRAQATQAKEEFKAKYPNRDDFQKAWLLYRVY